MLQLRLHPTADVSTGFLFFDYRLDQPGSYQGGVTSTEIGQEVNFFLDWAATDLWSISQVAAVEEAHYWTQAFE